MRALFIGLALLAATEAARISVSRGKNATKLETLCARMHNNTALEGLDPIEMLKDTAFECQRKCVDMFPSCSAVVYYYVHNETKHHYCYLFEHNSVHDKVMLVEQKPESKKDLVRMLEIVADCHQFDAHPPLEEDGVASSTDKVDRKKRQNGDEQMVKTMGEWTDWSDCAIAPVGHEVRSQACEYGRRIQRRGCPARQPPQRIDPRDPRYQQPFIQQPDPRQDPRYQQPRPDPRQDARYQQQLAAQQRQQQRPDPRQDPRQQQQPQAHPDPRQQQPQQIPQQLQVASHPDPRQQPPPVVQQPQHPQHTIQHQRTPPQAPQQSPDPRQDPRYLQQLAEHQRRIQQQQSLQSSGGFVQTHDSPNAPTLVHLGNLAPSGAIGPLEPPANGRLSQFAGGNVKSSHQQAVQQQQQQQQNAQQYQQRVNVMRHPAVPNAVPCTSGVCVPPRAQPQAPVQPPAPTQVPFSVGPTRYRPAPPPAPVCKGDGCAEPQQAGEWHDWSDWSECSCTCGDGLKQRRRECNGNNCQGAAFESAPCNMGPCQTWSDWCEWSECKGSCGRGERTRTRFCFLGTQRCEGKDFEVDVCDAGPCPEWSEWEDWSQCSVTCGSGVVSRQRTCLGGIHGDHICPGPRTEERPCDVGPCSIWESWQEWSQCSASCGDGMKRRIRVCQYGTDCHGPSEESLFCYGPPCAAWTDWCEWSACSVRCGPGQRSRTRACLTSDGHETNTCAGPGQETILCNERQCCQWSDWCPWSQCDRDCGTGQAFRTRVCQRDGVMDDSCECQGPDRESRECNSHACQPQCAWTEWCAWSDCSTPSACELGVQQRSRQCVGEPGCHCMGLAEENQQCRGTIPCSPKPPC